MKPVIYSYEDLLRHKAELEDLVEEKRGAVRAELKSLENTIKPITGFAEKIVQTVRPINGLSNLPRTGASLIFFLAKNLIFKKAGRLPKALYYLLFG